MRRENSYHESNSVNDGGSNDDKEEEEEEAGNATVNQQSSNGRLLKSGAYCILRRQSGNISNPYELDVREIKEGNVLTTGGSSFWSSAGEKIEIQPSSLSVSSIVTTDGVSQSRGMAISTFLLLSSSNEENGEEREGVCYWACGWQDGSVIIRKKWGNEEDRKSSSELALLIGHQRAVECMTQLGDGSIISGSRDHTLKRWKLPPLAKLQEFKALISGREWQRTQYDNQAFISLLRVQCCLTYVGHDSMVTDVIRLRSTNSSSLVRYIRS